MELRGASWAREGARSQRRSPPCPWPKGGAAPETQKYCAGTLGARARRTSAPSRALPRFAQSVGWLKSRSPRPQVRHCPASPRTRAGEGSCAARGSRQFGSAATLPLLHGPLAGGQKRKCVEGPRGRSIHGGAQCLCAPRLALQESARAQLPWASTLGPQVSDAPCASCGARQHGRPQRLS